METNVEDASISDASSALAATQIDVEPRKMHLKDSKWDVCSDASQGRFLVAKEDIAAGEIVLQELPYAFVPFEGPEGQVRQLESAKLDNRSLALQPPPTLSNPPSSDCLPPSL